MNILCPKKKKKMKWEKWDRANGPCMSWRARLKFGLWQKSFRSTPIGSAQFQPKKIFYTLLNGLLRSSYMIYIIYMNFLKRNFNDQNIYNELKRVGLLTRNMILFIKHLEYYNFVTIPKALIWRDEFNNLIYILILLLTCKREIFNFELSL